MEGSEHLESPERKISKKDLDTDNFDESNLGFERPKRAKKETDRFIQYIADQEVKRKK
jgi:hypothetical protein